MTHSKPTSEPSYSGIQLFLKTVAALRHPESGCPWDLAQTHETLMKYFHEELHEFQEALQKDGPSSPKTWDELGDLLLQIGLHCQLGSEKGYSSFDEVARLQAEKLIRRHPHVFDPAFPRFKTPAEVSAAWEQIKAWAKNPKHPPKQFEPSSEPQTMSQSLNPGFRADQVHSVPRSLPSLLRSSRIGEKAAAYRFDWPEAEQVLSKIHEEIAELEADKSDNQKAQEELGDLLFACAQYARKRGWDPEQVLDRANEKFCLRFKAMEASVSEAKLDWNLQSLEELESHWTRIKKP